MNFVLQAWQLMLAVLWAANRLINAGTEFGRFSGKGPCGQKTRTQTIRKKKVYLRLM
jgi:hypothetical protein